MVIVSEQANNFGGVLDVSSKTSERDKFNDDPIEIVESLSKESVQVSNSTPESKSGPTPPPSGLSSKSVPKLLPTKQQPGNNVSIEKMFETFHQASNGEFKPTFYNPFEVRHRRRTSRSQFKILERAFMENCKPTSHVRKQLAQELGMSVRSIQVWFQNRRAKLKTMLKNGKMTDKQMKAYLATQQCLPNDESDLVSDSESNLHHDSPSSFEDSEVSDCEGSDGNKKDSSAVTNMLNVVKRSLPPSNVIPSHAPIVTESMPHGNSYPNQVRNRSYSLPAIQRSPQLPFKQLQEALFGYPPNTSQSTINQPTPAQMTLPLNAFQHYLRASNAVMSQVNNGNYIANGINNGNSALSNYYSSDQGINIPQLNNNFVPLNEFNQQQVDPNRFRPRSSSIASSSSNCRPNQNSCYFNDILTIIKEDSPISEYISIVPGSYEQQQEQQNQQQQQQHHQHQQQYYNDSSESLGNQITSLDLDYFMANNHRASYHDDSGHDSVNSMLSTLHSSSNSHSPIISDCNTNRSTTTSNNINNNVNIHHYIDELNFLPQPTNEILLSTLIGDEHFLQ